MTQEEREALFSEMGPSVQQERGRLGGAKGGARAAALFDGSGLPGGSGLADGGSRVAYGTGAVREGSEGKGRYDLLPMEALRRLAVHYEKGAAKYADENWRRGMPLRRCMESLLRHACMFMQGNRDEDHLAAVMWNAAAVIEIQDMISRGLLDAGLDDLPNWTGGASP